MMEIYRDFAQVYDILMDQAPYEEWHRFLVDTLRSEGIRDGLILDLGCGTGTMTQLLALDGYDMIGLDNSPEMLNEALEKRERSGLEILYIQQDMCEFELYGTVRAVISTCDCLNYLLEESQLMDTFRLVNTYLDPGGLFLFDMNTAYLYEHVIGNSVIAENRDNCSFIWENYYDVEEAINEYDLTLFVRSDDGEEESEDIYRKYNEVHLQRGYEPQRIIELLGQSGLSFLRALDANTHGPIRPESERVFFIARKKEK